MDQGFANAVATLIDQHGGVSGLLTKFQQGGLGDVAKSWVQDGSDNQPVSQENLQDTLDKGAVKKAADQSGMSVESFVSQLSNHLPGIIDHMTPGGQVQNSSVGGLANMAMGFFRRHVT